MNVLPRAFRILIVAAISISIPSGDLTRFALAASSGGRPAGRPMDIRPPTDSPHRFDSQRGRLERSTDEFSRTTDPNENRTLDDFQANSADVTFRRSRIGNGPKISRQWFDATERHAKGKIATFISIPRNDAEYRKIFGDLPTEQNRLAIQEVLKSPEMLRESEPAQEPRNSGNSPFQNRVSATGFDAFLRKEPADLITIIGHNDHGSFKFPDGSFMRLEDMSRLCVYANKVCVFLSCHASKYVQRPSVGIRRSLDYGEALAIAAGLSSIMPLYSLLRNSKGIETYLSEFVTEREDKGIRLEYLQIGSGSTILVLIALAILSDDDDK